MGDGFAAAPLADGRYVLLEVVGEGGMAVVYRGFDARLQVPRAVKVLSPALSGKRALRERFEAEARTMALFDHPNIVRVVDVGIDGDRVYIVMELVTGGSVLERVRDFGPLPPRLALDVMIDVMRALEAAHEHGVVHRDIKPHNILLTEKGQVRVTDFGIARLVEGDEIDDALTRTGAVMGTWGFMAPEQKENAKGVDYRADLYSAGATLWAIVTNQTPGHLFAADLDSAMMGGIPEPLAVFIKRATRYRRDDRFGSAAEMLAAALVVREQLDAPPADVAPLGAQKTGVRPSTRARAVESIADGPKLAQKHGTTMVPDMTPPPPDDDGSGARRSRSLPPGGSLLSSGGSSAPGKSSSLPGGAGRTWPWAKPAGGIEVDLDESNAGVPPRTWIALALISFIAAIGMVLVLRHLMDRPVPAGSAAGSAAGAAAGAAAGSAAGSVAGSAAGSAAANATSASLAGAAPTLAEPASEAVPKVEAPAASKTQTAGASAAPSSSGSTKPRTGGAASGGTASGSASSGATSSSKGTTAAKATRGSPGLSHTPITRAAKGQKVDLKVRITGKGEYDDIRVNYRALGGTVWSNQPMYPTGDGYVASLVATGILEKGFEYFILARPADPDLPPLSSGTYREPHAVVVE